MVKCEHYRRIPLEDIESYIARTVHKLALFSLSDCPSCCRVWQFEIVQECVNIVMLTNRKCSEFEENQRVNERERKLVASDIRIAKRVQSREESRARQRGILLERDKEKIAQAEAQIAESIQNDEVARFVDLKEREHSGEQLAKELLEEEQKEFKRREKEAKRREQIARADQERAERLQKEEIEGFRGRKIKKFLDVPPEYTGRVLHSSPI